jgi:hypothetical protein
VRQEIGDLGQAKPAQNPRILPYFMEIPKERGKFEYFWIISLPYLPLGRGMTFLLFVHYPGDG